MACTDVQTIQAGNGTKTQFSFDFPYIFKSEIHVYFWNAVTKEYDEKLTTDATYPWQITDANPTIVEFTGTAPPSPATPVDPGEPTVDNVKIRRITKVDDIRALFNPGSAIRSDDLNKNFEQLRYAIQEANCAGIPDDVDEYLKNYYWDRYDNTLYNGDTWVSDDTKIATTAALDARFQDEVNDTFTKAELAAASNIMPDDDVAVPTTGALDNYINEVLTNDIAGSDGVSITDDGDGTITVGLTDDSVDFDKIKDADQIQLADQVADPDVVGTDNNIFTAQAATRRFNNYYQNDAPSTTDGIGIGQVWVDPNDDLTLSVWSGSNWVGITSGGTFSNQPKVIYVDANSGDDTNDGHRISRPKKTIAAALSDINSDSVDGDGSIVSVAPGIYAETLPLDIQKNDVGIIGQSLRTCIIHPKIAAADIPTYDVDTPNSQELQTMFRVNSGSYFTNLTLMGLKASGTRGGNSLYTDSTYGLPTNQGWNFGFYPNAVIKKSPYIQNVTNFSDSQINNVTFTPHTPGEGAAGDLDSAPTGGGILIDGSVPDSSSPLRSMVCDSYTHTALDGPGIFVTNNGYCQATSSYAFFNHAHITCVNGGQANLAASTTDFGRFGLIADGKSSSAIFTSNVDGAASDGDTTFNINAPTAASDWFGSATRPANNMLVTVNSVTYPVLSATSYTDSEGGAGWTVTISRPDPNDTATNLGLNGAVSDDAAVSFFLRSMIASSGHTMEYVGSGTDYTALPENGGVPVDSQQIVERNDGKVWAATTDHKGTFKVGNFFTVDQQAGSLTVNSGSFQVDLNTLNVNIGGQAEVGADLDMGANELTSSTGDLKLQASGNINVQTNKIINVTDPTAAQDAATKAYVDANAGGDVVDDASPQLGGNLDVNGYQILSTGNGDVTINPAGTGDIILDANVGIGTTSPTANLHGSVSSGNFSTILESTATSGESSLVIGGKNSSGTVRKLSLKYDNSDLFRIGTAQAVPIRFETSDTERMRIDSSGRVLIGTSNAVAFGSRQVLTVANGTTGGVLSLYNSTTATANTRISSNPTGSEINDIGIHAASTNGSIQFYTNNDTERMRINSSGHVGIGTSSPNKPLHIYTGSSDAEIRLQTNSGTEQNSYITLRQSSGDLDFYTVASGSNMKFHTVNAERMRIDSSGNVGIGTTNPLGELTVSNGGASGIELQPEITTNTNRITNYNRSASSYNNFRLDAAQHEFLISGSEKVRINSSGNVGIGNTVPISSAKLGLTATTGNARIGIQDSTANTWFGVANNNDNLQFERWNGSTWDVLTTIDNSGNVGIGTTSPGQPLAVVATSSTYKGMELITPTGDGSGEFIFGVHQNGSTAGRSIVFKRGGSDGTATVSMRITGSGQITNKSNFIDDLPGEGFTLTDHRLTLSGETTSTTTTPALRIGRDTYDGQLVTFHQDSTEEGSISVSGSTVSYNGGHLSRWSQTLTTDEHTGLLKGTVMTNLDEMCQWVLEARDEVLWTEEDKLPEGVSVGDVRFPARAAGFEDNEQLNKMAVSSVEGDPNVAGAFVNIDSDGDLNVAMTGDFIIRIAQGTTVARGDLLMSAGDGTAKPQDDDIVRSKTIAKVTSTNVTCTYDDGSYCVPCVLMAC